MRKIHPGKKLKPERILAMRMICYGYDLCEGSGRIGRNTSLSGIECRVRESVSGKGEYKSFEDYLAWWLGSVMRLGYDATESRELMRPYAREFVVKNRLVIAAVELSL